MASHGTWNMERTNGWTVGWGEEGEDEDKSSNHTKFPIPVHAACGAFASSAGALLSLIQPSNLQQYNPIEYTQV